MSRIPDTRPTPAGPAYEGRLLDRPEEEVVDQGIAFDLRTLLSRRGMLGLAGAGVGAVLLAACAPSTASSVSATPTATPTPSATARTGTSEGIAEIPDETAGPYPADGSNGPDVLADSGIVRQDIRSSIDGSATAQGVPLSFELQIIDLAAGGVPFAGAAVYAWHCTAQGEYSLYSSGLEDVTYLRGVQVADADGRVSFSSVFPGCYSGRWPHIHFEIYPDIGSIGDAANAVATSQLALPEAECAVVYARPEYDGSARNLAGITLESDNVFGEDSATSQLAALVGDVPRGYAATLVVGVDTSTPPAAGGGAPPSR